MEVYFGKRWHRDVSHSFVDSIETYYTLTMIPQLEPVIVY